MKLNLLRDKIRDSGMTITFIAKKIEMTRETLYNKLNGIAEFKVSEIRNISKILHLSDEERNDIFFAE